MFKDYFRRHYGEGITTSRVEAQRASGIDEVMQIGNASVYSLMSLLRWLQELFSNKVNIDLYL